MANGLKDTMMMILGEQEDIYFISFTPSDSIEDFRKRVNVIYHSIDEDRQVLFLTDLYGGTPNHVATAMKIAEPNRVEVLSGVNMPLLMEATLGKTKVLSDIVEHLLEPVSYTHLAAVSRHVNYITQNQMMTVYHQFHFISSFNFYYTCF